MGAITWFVPGRPAGKGSLRAFTRKGGGVGLEEGNAKKVRPWMHAVASGALEAGVRCLDDGAVGLVMFFRLARPKGHYGRGGNAEKLLPSAPASVTTKPDVDKMVRAVMDALTGVAYRDDCQVVRLDAMKRYADPGEPEGVQLTLTTAESVT